MVVSEMTKKKKQSYTAIPSRIIRTISSKSVEPLIHSIRNKSPDSLLSSRSKFSIKNSRFWILFVVIFGSLGMFKMYFNFDHLLPFSPNPCVILQEKALTSRGYASVQHTSVVSRRENRHKKLEKHEKVVVHGGGDADHEFWKQPDGKGYRPCLEFSDEYRKESKKILKNRRRYIMVVVAGGLNQQRYQIVDAVVIARILGASLVVPVLQVNWIWNDESEFSDLFDLDHFKKELEDDVRVVLSIPSTLMAAKPIEIRETPFNITPEWIRAKYSPSFEQGFIVIRSLDSRLSKDLPPDLQKLRCKVDFLALRYHPKIVKLGNKLTERMRNNGPYLALHLRMEKDVWVRTGCLPGLSPEYDEMIMNERQNEPKFLTSRSNLSYYERKMAGLCPLNAVELTRLLKALGAPKSAKIYWAGGDPLGGKDVLQPLKKEYPHLYNKEDIALPGELEPFADKASVMTAIDCILSLNSDVFMPSHGGNMGRLLQGHRAFAGHRKTITPNKRMMLTYFQNSSLSEAEFNMIIKKLHKNALGQPTLRTTKPGRNPFKFPVPDCMCNNSVTDSLD